MPSTDEEAFLAAGINVFPETHIRNCFEPAPGHRGRLELDPRSAGRAQFASDPTGPLRVYKKPGKDQAYFIGADPAYGHGEDLAAAQVINRRTKEQVAVFHAKLNPIAFADELARLGAWYNMATIAPEVEGPGQASIGRLVSVYPHVWTQVHADKMPGRERSFTQAGWSTSWRRKAWVLSYLANHLERGLIVLHDRPTYHELRNYVYYGSRGSELWGPGEARGHDDLVMALAIAVLCESTEPVLARDDALATPRLGRIAGQNTIWAASEEDDESAGVDVWADL